MTLHGKWNVIWNRCKSSVVRNLSNNRIKNGQRDIGRLQGISKSLVFFYYTYEYMRPWRARGDRMLAVDNFTDQA